MVWVLLCALVALFGLGYLGLQAREVVRKGKRLLVELEEAAQRLEAAAADPAAGDGAEVPPDGPAGPPGGSGPSAGEASRTGRRTLPVPDQRR